jgi:hypothetical protein
VEEPLDLFRLAGKRYEQAGCPAGAPQAAAAEAWTMLQLGHRTEAAQRAREVLALPRADPSWPPGLTARITLGLAVARENPRRRRSSCAGRRRWPVTAGTSATRRGA